MPRLFAVFLLGAGCIDAPQDGKPDDSSSLVDTQIDREDRDGDGFTDDCDDDNPDVFPGATEFCDGIDNDCDNVVDEDAMDATSWFADIDGDGYGSPDSELVACEMPAGYSANSTDCDDTDARFNPSAIESDCEDPNDYNCDGSIGYADADGDGYAACTECDDDNADIHPDGIESCNGLDDDCNGLVDDEDPLLQGGTTWYADADSDGFGGTQFTATACDAPDGYVDNQEDCDDLNADTYPSAAEICDEEDNDCDTDIDEGVGLTWYADADGDGYGNANNPASFCDAPQGYSANGNDCDDGNASVSPAGIETCDGTDNDCDGAIDESAINASTWFADTDGDGHGDPSASQVACDAPSGTVASQTDCNDADASSHPGADELCDNADNDCDGSVDEYAVDQPTWYADTDGDGYGNPLSTNLSCDMPSGYVSNTSDCNDNNSAIHPAATETWYDGTDADCDGASDYDADADGSNHEAYGGTDCNDSDATIHPTATESWYDGTDQNCDGSSDFDQDGDGTDSDTYGGTDCDDTNATIHFTATETWYDGIDQDCDGASDYDADSDGEESSAWGGGDCNDSDAAVNSLASEIWYDGVDQNCDGLSDYDQDGDSYESVDYGGTDNNDTDPNCWDQCSDGSSQNNAGETCVQLLGDYPNSTDGEYWIDPDADGNTSNAFQVYCDMSSGGWTRCLEFQNTAAEDFTGNTWFDTCVDYTSASWTGSEVRVHLMNESGSTLYDQSGSRPSGWTYTQLTSTTATNNQYDSGQHNRLVDLGNGDKLFVAGQNSVNSGCGGSFGNGYAVVVYPSSPNYHSNPKMIVTTYWQVSGGYNSARSFSGWSQSHEISGTGNTSFNTCSSTPAQLGTFEFYVK